MYFLRQYNKNDGTIINIIPIEKTSLKWLRGIPAPIIVVIFGILINEVLSFSLSCGSFKSHCNSKPHIMRESAKGNLTKSAAWSLFTFDGIVNQVADQVGRIVFGHDHAQRL